MVCWGAYSELLVIWIAPILLWVFGIQFANGTMSLLSNTLATGVITAGIGAGYVLAGNTKPKVFLLAIIAGMSIGLVGYWGLKFGLPVNATVYEATDLRLERVGGGRGDANSVGLNLPVAMWCFLGLFLLDESKFRIIHMKQYAFQLIIVLLVIFFLPQL